MNCFRSAALCGVFVLAPGALFAASSYPASPARALENAISYRSEIIADAPLAYYPLDEKVGEVAHDLGPHHLDAAIGTHVLRGRDAIVRGSQYSMEFLGADRSTAAEDVRLPRTPYFEFKRDFSYEAWVKPETTSVYGNNEGYIDVVSYGHDENPDQQHCRWELGFDAQGHVFNAQMVILGHPTNNVLWSPRAMLARAIDRLTGDKLLARAMYPTAGAGNPALAHRLYQLAATYDGHRIRMYINGALRNMLEVEGRIAGYTAKDGLAIGGEYADVHPVFRGRISDVSVYDRVLGAEDIARHYRSGLPRSSGKGNGHERP